MAYKTKRFYRNNFGLPGVVYILENEGLRDGWVKIGCSTRSGKIRAFELNEDASTGTPGSFKCIYQHKTVDCGRAEQEVFRVLAAFRRGKRGQEFFEVSFDLAKNTIEEICKSFDSATKLKTNLSSKPNSSSSVLNHRRPVNRRPLPRSKNDSKVSTSIGNKNNTRTGIIETIGNKFCDKCSIKVMSSMRLCPQCGNKSFALTTPNASLKNSIFNYFKRFF